MAWDSSLPTNSGLLINAPAQIRANWTALALGTDASLLVTDAKVSGSAAIQESKVLFATGGHGHTGGTDGKTIITGFVTGDWILSTVTTARTGWTDVSASYTDKFIRLNATAASGGADTHTHTTDYLPSHIHTGPSHTHGSSGLSGSTDSQGGHNHGVLASKGSNQGDSGSVLTSFSDGGHDSWSYMSTGGAHTHTVTLAGSTDSGGNGNTAAASAGSATTSSTSNVPVFVRAYVFQKN